MNDWITDSQDELSFDELIRDVDQIHIPIFQRSYVWKKREFDYLIHDIEQIENEIESSQFLGAVVAYERPRVRNIVGRMRIMDLVDGQQRMLTLYIFIMAIIERMADHDKEFAAEVAQEYLLLSQRRGLEINTRIVPSLNDRKQFSVLWNRLNSPEIISEQLLNNPPKLPISSGDENGDLLKQYIRIMKYINNAIAKSDDVLNHLRNLLEIVARKLTFVHLKLNDASVAMKIFERLNFRGVKVGIVDLVRNEVFSRVGNEPDRALSLYQDTWKPFVNNFQSREDAFFFPYSLIHNNNVKKSELFTELREMWNGKNPNQIIEHMIPFQVPFMAIDYGTQGEFSQEIDILTDNLYRFKCPSAIYSFIIKLLFEFKNENISEEDTLNILKHTESFLVRRAIIGFEPTGLHALYKSLWQDISSNPTAEFINEIIESKPTIQKPNNDELKDAIKTRPLAKTRICPYLLIEYDKSLPGDTPNEDLTIEHVLPVSYDESNVWSENFTLAEHKLLRDTWANIIPLSMPLNSSLQRSAYNIKKERYLIESMFVSARNFATSFDEWTPVKLMMRAEELCNWAINRWKYF